MRILQNWYLVQLNKPTIIGNVYGDKERFPGYELQLTVFDIDAVNKLLYTYDGVYKLGDADKVWWNARNFRDYN